MLYDALTDLTPVSGGWTDDKKYRAAGPDGSQYFLRIASPERGPRLERAFRAQTAACDLGLPVARPVECGPCGQGFYTLEAWINGADPQEILPNLPKPEVYAHGLEAGRILKKLHSVPAPGDRPDWGALYNAKLDRRIAEYRACGLQYDKDTPLLAGIEENRSLLFGRPQVLQHGDYHPGNFLFAGRQLTVIDFDRTGWGDPWEEFGKIFWCVRADPVLACGMVDGYFGGEIPAEFWRLLQLYVCSWAVGSLAWAIPYGADEIRVMREATEQVLDWYTGGPVPGWYTERWKKGEGYMSAETKQAIKDQVSGWMTETPLETDLVLLRPFRPEDQADYIELVSQPELQRLAGISYTDEAEKEADFRDHLADDHPPVHFAVVWKQTGKVVGSFSFGIYPFVVTDPKLSKLRGVSLSCMLRQEFQRRGIMTGVFRAFLDLCLVRHDLDFVNAGYFDFNEASRRLQEACGFHDWMDHKFRFQGRDITTREMLLFREDYYCGSPGEL